MPSLPVDEEDRCVAFHEWQNSERTSEEERVSKLCELHNLSWSEFSVALEPEEELIPESACQDLSKHA